MTVAAVVVTYRRPNLLMQCLRALQTQTRPVDEIIVVDNASGDGTAGRVRTEFPEATLRVLDENRGGAGGFHEGMKIAAGRDVDWIWVMDDDAEPEPDALEQLFSPGIHRRDDTFGLASLRVDPDGGMQRGSAGRYDPFRMQYDRVGETGPRVESINYATFVGFLVRQEALRRVGLPEAGFFIRGDDNEYVYRLAKEGNVYLVRASRIIHHDASQSKQIPTQVWDRFWGDRPVESYWMTYYEHRNKLLTVRMHAQTIRQRWQGTITATLHLLRSALAALAFDSHKRLRLTVLTHAFWHGVTGQSGKFYDPQTFPDSASPATRHLSENQAG
jgi:GT2 family glycosyltransferase